MGYSPKTYVFTLAQIQDGDISDFLDRFDPDTLPANDLAGMCGALRVRVEGVQMAHEVFADPRRRRFFRKLHAHFPHLGFFLKIHPIRSKSHSPALTDASIFVAICLCHTDILMARRDGLDGQAVGFNAQQFNAFLVEVQRHLTALGKRAGFTSTAIDHRNRVVIKTIRSFFRFTQLRKITSQP